MDFQKIQTWLQQNSAVYYRIEDGQKKKRAGATKLPDPEAVFTHFKAALEILPEGKYTLVASDNPSNSRAAVSFPFEKEGSIFNQNYSDMGGNKNIQDLLAEAEAKGREAGRSEARWENMVERVTRIEAKVDKLQQAIIELITSDQDEGDNLLDKVEEATSAAELFKDKFKDFKL